MRLLIIFLGLARLICGKRIVSEDTSEKNPKLAGLYERMNASEEYRKDFYNQPYFQNEERRRLILDCLLNLPPYGWVAKPVDTVIKLEQGQVNNQSCIDHLQNNGYTIGEKLDVYSCVKKLVETGYIVTRREYVRCCT